jgi:hypothetical protein
MKPRILYFLNRYPQLSETYIRTEISSLREDFDIFVVTAKPADVPYATNIPFVQTTDEDRIVGIVRDLNPRVLHAHYMSQAALVSRLAGAFGLPYTIRAHSCDVMGPCKGPWSLSDHCLGVLAFPFTRALLRDGGVADSRIIDCWPVIDYRRFHDPSPNGAGVLNTGAALAKKRFEDFVDLARLVPGRTFRIYAIGYDVQKLVDYNRARGSPVEVRATVAPEEMPRVYKEHEWLVYTACPTLAEVGWPMAVAEAQAAGLGVCLPKIRPDLEEYLGGAGYLYESIHEIPEILARPYPQEMRERGFEHAKRSDIEAHKRKLTDLWAPWTGPRAHVRDRGLLLRGASRPG